jgi:hypothetical protein
MSASCKPSSGGVERGDVAVDPLARRLMPAGDLVVILGAAQIGERQHMNCLPHVVEDDHVIEQTERQIRQPAVVRRRVGQALDVPNRIVAGVADGSADEWRQLGQVNHPHRLHLFAQRFQRIGDLEFLGLPRFLAARRDAAADLHLRAAGLQQQEGIASDEAIAADLFAADNAFEETGGLAAIEPAERLHRREGVAQEFTIDGNEVGALSEFDEPLERGKMGHELSKA